LIIGDIKLVKGLGILWNSKSKKTKAYTKLLECRNQLFSVFNLVKAKAIKAKFAAQNERHKTLLDLITYHNENMSGPLK
jgi:hypothetical protein